jgi:hemerythrin
MALQWTPDLATEIQEIDDQHKELFRRVDALINAWKAGKAGPEAEQTFTFLGDYVVEHFGAEERFMQQYNYGAPAAQHLSQHAVFVNTFKKLKSRYEAEGPTPSLLQDTQDTLVDWLKNHISYSDKALGLFLKMKMK